MTITWASRLCKQEQSCSAFRARSCLALPLALLPLLWLLCARLVQPVWMGITSTLHHLPPPDTAGRSSKAFHKLCQWIKNPRGREHEHRGAKMKAMHYLCTSKKENQIQGPLESYHRLILKCTGVLRAPEDKWKGSKSEGTDYFSSCLPFCRHCGDRCVTTGSRGGLKQPCWLC